MRSATANLTAFCSNRPLVHVQTAMAALDKSEDQVLAMIESGKLLWAWNIASKSAARRELRIWRASVLASLNDAPQPDSTEEEVLASLFPHPAPILTTPQVQRMLSASQCHVYRLIESGALQALNKAHGGRLGYVRVTRASVCDFLKLRRVL